MLTWIQICVGHCRQACHKKPEKLTTNVYFCFNFKIQFSCTSPLSPIKSPGYTPRLADNFLQILLHFSLLLLVKESPRPLPAKVGFFHVLKDYFSRQIASATRQIRKLVKQKYESYVTASLQGTCTVSLYLLVSNILFLVFKIYLRYICIFSY